jgi:hypothetical protein
MAYNGWTNYETWNVALWIDNEPGSYEQRRDLARAARNAWQLADSLRDWILEDAPNLGGLYGDLLGAALGEVNWQEIAENWYAEEHGDDDEDDNAEEADAEPARANGEDVA